MTLSFREAGKRYYPAQSTDYSAQATETAVNAKSVAGDVFSQVYSTAGPAWLKAAAAGDLHAALSLVKAVASALPSPFDSAEVSQFLDLIDQAAARVEDVIDNPKGALVETVTDILGGLTDLTPKDTGAGYPTAAVTAALEVVKFGQETGSELASDYGGALAPIPALTETRQRQAANRNSLVELVRQMSAASGVEAALNVEYDSYDQAAQTRESLLTCLDGLMEQTRGRQRL